MFCPQCGSSQSDELRFCKSCGANLYAVRQVVATREAGETFDWSKTWLAEMFLSREEQKRRTHELERRRGITPEVRRYNEIKAGIITGSVGLGVMIFLYVLMQGIILGGDVSPGDVAILSRLWVCGLIPVFVGLALMINGLFVSKKIVELARRERGVSPNALEGGKDDRALRAADTTEFIPSGFSVTEGTTKHLNESKQNPSHQNNT